MFEQHSPFCVQLAEMARQAPQAFPPSARSSQRPEQHSPAVVQAVPSAEQAMQPPSEHWPEQQLAFVVHEVGLPVGMQLAHWPPTQRRPVQHAPPSPHAPPGPEQL
jgi:hypothetical protein